MSTLSFHFHGYQPGDIVRWREPDPLRPQTFEQRHSPVVLRLAPDRIAGRNWTYAAPPAGARRAGQTARRPRRRRARTSGGTASAIRGGRRVWNGTRSGIRVRAHTWLPTRGNLPTLRRRVRPGLG